MMDFPLQNALRWALTTEEDSKMTDLRQGGLLLLYRTLAQDFVYADPNALVIFPDNHDMSRIFTQLREDLGLYRMAIAYTLTMRGTPQIYYGTEILMSHPDSETHGMIRSDFPGGWQDDRKNAFTGEGLSSEQKKEQNTMRTLLNWRRDKEVIHTGKVTHFRPENGTYVYFRSNAEDSVMVVLNKNEETTSLPLKRFAERLKGFTEAKNVITGATLVLGDELALPPKSALVLELR